MKNGITRRTVVRGTAVVGAMAAAGVLIPAAASAADRSGKGVGKRGATKPQNVTANGWPVQAIADRDSQVYTRTVSGTGLSVPVWIGDPEAILLHVVRRFHYEVDQLHSPDLAGWQKTDGLDRRKPESNLASGTAVRIRPGAAAKGSLFPLQELVVRDILADCQGTVRWGGDDSSVDESLFYLDRGPDDAEIRKIADMFRTAETTPGQGAGTEVNVHAAARRKRAKQLVRQQQAG